MISLRQIADFWNLFFFYPIPAYTIALFRIVFGLVLLFDAFYILMNAREYLGPDGLLSHKRFKSRYKGRALSVFLILPGTMPVVYTVLGLHIFFLLMMIVGLFTTVSTIFVFVTLSSIIKRNVIICNGGDNVARMMCLLLIFSSSGHAFSFDTYLFHMQTPLDGYTLIAPWAMRLMQIQVSIIYIYTVYWKLKGATYRNGTAMYYVMSNDNYRRFRIPGILLTKPYVQILTWGALVVEFILGIGLWITDIHYAILLVGLLFHIAIEYILNVHLFGWYMMASLLLFINPADLWNFIHGLYL